MNGRLISGLVAFFVLGPVSLGLLFEEHIEDLTKTGAAAATEIDPLGQLTYNASSRHNNFVKFGFDEAEAGKIDGFVEALEKKLLIGVPERDVIAYLVGQTDDTDQLENALCGRLNPSRYTALQLLVEERQGELVVMDLADLPRFEAQPWYDKDRPVMIANGVDVIPNRREDATRMGLAAVFARAIPIALDQQSPWGASLFAGWSWEGVKKKYRSVDDKVEHYVATMHLVMENVTADGGFCLTQ